MNRRKLLAVVAVLFAAAMISGVAAWLSDGETQIDAIVTGNVSIALSEENWRPENASEIHPEDILPQNPVVTNTGSADAYVFVAVSMSCLRSGAQISEPTALLEIQSPLPLYTTISRQEAFEKDNWMQLLGPLYDNKLNSVTTVYAYGKNNTMTPLAPGATTTAVFDAVKLRNIVRVDDVMGLDANVYVHAYAIQASELGDNGSAVGPSQVWNIVRNTYDVQLASQALPETTPKVLQVRVTPSPTPKPKAKSAQKASSSGENDWLKEWTAEASTDDENDEVFLSIFGKTTNPAPTPTPTPKPTGKRSVG